MQCNQGNVSAFYQVETKICAVQYSVNRVVVQERMASSSAWEQKPDGHHGSFIFVVYGPMRIFVLLSYNIHREDTYTTSTF